VFLFSGRMCERKQVLLHSLTFVRCCLEMSLIRDVLVHTLQDTLHLFDEILLAYIEEELEAFDGHSFSDLASTVGTVFTELSVVATEEESNALLKDILNQIAPINNVACSDSNVACAAPKLSNDMCVLTPSAVIALTHSSDSKVRKSTLRDMCPCHVKANIEALWQRIMEMHDDPDPKVRYQVMHNLCDGSPLSREADVIRTLESMHNDQDKKVRRQVHRVLTHYRRTGRWNIL